MRGRVSAVSGLAISASNELGELQSGVAAALLGPVGAVVFGGAAAIVNRRPVVLSVPRIDAAHEPLTRRQQPCHSPSWRRNPT